VECDPHNDGALENICAVYLRQGKYQLAAAYALAAIKANRYVVNRQTMLAYALAHLGQTDKAMPYYRNAIRLAPQKATVYHDHGLALLDLGQVDDAIGEFQKALKLEPAAPDVLLSMSMALEQKGQIAEAKTWCVQALQQRGNWLERYNGEYQMGSLLVRQGRLEEALTHYRQAVALKPDFAEAYNGLGVAWLKLGQPEPAILEFQKALQAQPELAEAQVNLAVAYEAWAGGLAAGGDFPKAMEMLRAAVQIAQQAGRQDLVQAYHVKMERYRAGKP